MTDRAAGRLIEKLYDLGTADAMIRGDVRVLTSEVIDYGQTLDPASVEWCGEEKIHAPSVVRPARCAQLMAVGDWGASPYGGGAPMV